MSEKFKLIEKYSINTSTWFWDIIKNSDQNQATLRAILKKLTKEQIIKFQEQFLDAAGVLQDDPFIDYIEDSEDGLEDVSYLVVSRGEEYYFEILQYPEKIPETAEGFQILFGVADEVCIELYGESTGIY